MQREEEIITRLDRLEALLTPLAAQAASLQELREELTPRVNEAVKALIMELAEIEGDVQLEDLLYTVKKAVRSIHNVSTSLDYLSGALGFVETAEPLLRTSVPHAIEMLDTLERDNVFVMLGAVLNALQEVGKRFSGSDLQQLEEGLKRLGAASTALFSPEATTFIEHAAQVPARVDLQQAREATMGSLFKALRDKGTIRGMAVLLQLARAMDPEYMKSSA